MSNFLTKQPEELITYDLPFYELPALAAITSITEITIVPHNLTPVVMALTSSNHQYQEQTVQFTLAGGTNGEEYLITAKVIDSNGQSFEADVELRVQDLSWSVPDGSGHIYVDPREYVQKFGYSEAVILCDQHDLNRIDTSKILKALQDATALVDGYLAKKYLVPLSPIPSMISAITANIARYMLHTENIQEVVEKNYTQDIRKLNDIAAGKLNLSVTLADSVSVGHGPSFVASKRIFTRDKLRGYS
jgi:phage gp36-like protein